MNAPAEMADRHGRALAELAELGMALARKVQVRALAAPDDEACDLALAFHRVSRSVRQTLALESRLAREQRQGEREAADLAAREALGQVQRRRAQVRSAVTRLIWDEAEGEEAESLLEDLESRLIEESLDEDFAAAPIEACIARLRADLGLAAAGRDDTPPEAPAAALRLDARRRRARDCDDIAYDAPPPWAAPADGAGWRSSA